MKKQFAKAVALFRVEPVIFIALAVLALIALLMGDFFTAIVLLTLIFAQGRIIVLRSKVRVLSVVAGVSVATLGALFNE